MARSAAAQGLPVTSASAALDRPLRALIVSTSRDRGALAAARSLRRSGWVVGVGTPDGGGMLGASRASSRTHVVPRPRRDGGDFLDGLRRAIEEGGYDIVFGGSDDWMAALSSYRDAIPARVAHPRWDAVAAALDRLRLATAARSAGLASPRTELATDAAMAAWRGPVVVKTRTHWFPGQTKSHRTEARLFPDVRSARDRIQHIRDVGAEPVLQEPVSGELGALIGIVAEGRLVGRVQQEASRLWPTPSGASARAETVPVDERLADRAEALLADLGWEGLVELQFLTGADGVPHLIDFNGRFFGSLALTERARPGLPDAWGRLVLEGTVPELEDAPAGMRYAWMAGDLRRAFAERRGGLAADVLDSLRWSRGAQRSIWDLRDPGPGLHLASARLRPRARRAPRER
ncbi:hypothetical protein [Agrococcus lahaulensis]|uniref:hypothetical protein n=1 Tax=Agrococcus lahaulensis TaxID=341722 RepID=UPI000687E495|nr:hypothetical protein [Agrococcus lahaulensis]